MRKGRQFVYRVTDASYQAGYFVLVYGNFVEVEPGLMTSNFIDVFIIYDLQFDNCEISFTVSEPQLVRHAIAML